jgi:hypothetical protein
LAEDQAGLRGVAAEEEDIYARGLHLRNQRGIVRLARGESLIQSHLNAALAQASSDGIGNACPPDGTVIQNRNLFVRPMLGEVFADHRPLLVVPTPQPKDVRAAFVGQLRTG